jgi:hypothetical protein
MQLFVYAMMWAECEDNPERDVNNIDVTIYPVRKIKSQGLVTLRVTRSNIIAFKKRLSKLLDEIKSKGEGNEEFKMCKDVSPCEFCDFASICNRGAEVKD